MSLTERHREVLEAALTLFSERGYAAATLRELARRLSISQPSLYTYFDSKEDLVAQIISHLGASMLLIPPDEPFPERLVDLPGFARRLTFRIWENPQYPIFVRFMFAMSLELPRFRDAIRELYTGLLSTGTQTLAGPFLARNEIAAEDVEGVVHMLLNALALGLIQERLLWGEPTATKALHRFADYVQGAAEDVLRLRRKQDEAAGGQADQSRKAGVQETRKNPKAP